VIDQSEDHQFVRDIAMIVRDADLKFESEGGSTRHWVRDYFLPKLNSKGYVIMHTDDLP
jgi:hypothetical protein